MSAEYEISCIADFLAVPHEKQAECLRDFATWLNMARNHMTLDALLNQALGGGLTFNDTSFYWIDDGIAGVTAVHIKEECGDRSMRLQVKGDD